MKSHIRRISLVIIFVSGIVTCAIAQENNMPPDGFTRLFNGRDLKGWTGGADRDPIEIAAFSDDEQEIWWEKMDADIVQHWRVEAGELINDGQGSFLATKEHFENFELYVDWKIAPGGDSGIYLRGIPQVQIWDHTHEEFFKHGAQHGSGGLWNNRMRGRFPSMVADRAIGQWNRMRVRMIGPFVTVWLNGKEVIGNVPLDNYFTRQRPVPLKGPIYLQTHGSETRFRNLFVREVAFEESAAILATNTGGDAGFEPLFNGKDLSGWTGAVEDYAVIDKAIQCRSGGEGALLTKSTFEDFIVRLEFKLSPGGNSGLAIRSRPTDVTPAFDAYEIQVLDDAAEKHSNLKPFQHHGSLYGIHPAIPGYLRPAGQWNYQETEVNGDTFRVELNGFEILNISLSQLPKETLNRAEHPGIDRRKGHFGFCGHHDPVAYRNVRIKRLSSN
jgi:hypothetical protein